MVNILLPIPTIHIFYSIQQVFNVKLKIVFFLTNMSVADKCRIGIPDIRCMLSLIWIFRILK